MQGYEIVDRNEIAGIVPVGRGQVVKTRCPNCLHPEMLEMDYVHIATADEVTMRFCQRCNCIVEVENGA